MTKLEQAQHPLYAIAVPGDAHNLDAIHKSGMTEIVFDDAKGYCITEDAPIFEGNWQIVGTATKYHIDFDVTEYVGKKTVDGFPGYFDYENPNVSICCKTPETSFRSLLTPNGIDFNDGQKRVFIKPV